MIVKVNMDNLELLEIYESCYRAADDLEYSYEEIHESISEHKKLGNVQFFEFIYNNPNMHLKNISPVIKYSYKTDTPKCAYCNINLGYSSTKEHTVKYIEGKMWVTGIFGWSNINITYEQKHKIRKLMKYDSVIDNTKYTNKLTILALVDIRKFHIIKKYGTAFEAAYNDLMFSVDEINNSLKNHIDYNGLQFFNVVCNGKTSDVRIKSNSYPVLEYKNGKFINLYKSANAAYEETGQYVAKYLSGKLKCEKENHSKWFKIDKCCK